MSRPIRMLVIIACAAAALALPATAQAHCTNPATGWTHVTVDGGGTWATLYEYGTNTPSYMRAGDWVYVQRFNGIWNYGYGTAWHFVGGQWHQHASWHWISHENLTC